MGKTMFTIIAAVMVLEPSIIRVRAVAGLGYAQRYGRAPGDRWDAVKNAPKSDESGLGLVLTRKG